MDPKEDTNPRWKVVCDSHGVLPEDCLDHIAATIVDEEHGEQCPASTEVLRSDDNDFQTARELAEEQPDDVRDDGDRGLEEFDSCSSCGGDPEMFCSACGAEAGGGTA